jgi:hypothetical protein
MSVPVIGEVPGIVVIPIMIGGRVPPGIEGLVLSGSGPEVHLSGGDPEIRIRGSVTTPGRAFKNAAAHRDLAVLGVHLGIEKFRVFNYQAPLRRVPPTRLVLKPQGRLQQHENGFFGPVGHFDDVAPQNNGGA